MVNYSWISVLPDTIQNLMLTKVIEGRRIKKNEPKTDICFPQWFDLVASFSQILGVWGLLGRRPKWWGLCWGPIWVVQWVFLMWGPAQVFHSDLYWPSWLDWIEDVIITERAEVTWTRSDYDGVCFREPAFVVRLKSSTFFALTIGASWFWVSL